MDARRFGMGIRVFLLTVLALLVFVSGTKAADVKVLIAKDGAVASSELKVNMDETPTMQFSYLLVPGDATVNDVVWSVRNATGDAESYASVDKTGTVTFHNATERGTPLYLYCTADGVESSPVELSVSRATEKLTGLRPRFSALTLSPGAEVNLYDNLVPIPGAAGLFSTDCIFSSTNYTFPLEKYTGILKTPEQTGLETTINVQVIGRPELTTSFTVTTSSPQAPTDLVGPKSMELATGKTSALNLELLPSTTTEGLDQTITYTSSDPEIASVDEYGTVIAKKAGTVTITATSPLGMTRAAKTVETQVNVIENVPVEGIATSETNIDLTTLPGGTTQKQLDIVYSPQNTTERSVKYTSLTPNVAMVSPDGVLTAVNEGRTTVKITDEREHIVLLNVNVSNTPVVAEYTTVSATDPDNFTVLVKNLHLNRSLAESGVTITKLSCFAFSSDDMSDVNAQIMQNATNSNDWIAYFTVNGQENHKFFTDASDIKLHIYAETSNGEQHFLGVTNYNYTNFGTVQSNITVTPYAENIGFITPSVGQDAIAGTIAQNRQLEGLRLSTPIQDLGINYAVHAADIGWMNEVHQGQYAGTMNQSRQLEALRMYLTGDAARFYTIQYRAHCEGLGWTNWVSDNEVTGTVGEGRQIEALQIRIIQR